MSLIGILGTKKQEPIDTGEVKKKSSLPPEVFFKLASQFGCVYNPFPELFTLHGCRIYRKNNSEDET